MKSKYILFIFLLIGLNVKLIGQPITDDNQIEINLLQLNDVYEISALDNGTVGGMARVATVRNKLVKENPGY